MTSNLEQIAEEMERHPTAQHAMNGYAARIRAWIAANKESPQREPAVCANCGWPASGEPPKFKKLP